MGRSNAQPCIEMGCYQWGTNNDSRCDDHKRASYTSNRRQRLPKDWRTLRKIVLNRDNYICYICGGAEADAVDHIVRGDNHSPSNLAAVHDGVFPHCHRKKTAQEALQAKKDKLDSKTKGWIQDYNKENMIIRKNNV